ncbi:hypothetical protein ACRRTK_019180 [Alexandromys fortis]
MGTSLDIKIKRANKVYHAGEMLSGVVVISSKDSVQHQGVSLTMEGTVNLQLSAKSVGVFEAFYNSVKPIQILNSTIDVLKPGKLPSGKTEIPFEFPLHVKGSKVLYETYHGVFVNIQYTLRCDMRRSLLAKDLTKTCEFIVHSAVGSTGQSGSTLHITSKSLSSVCPAFLFASFTILSPGSDLQQTPGPGADEQYWPQKGKLTPSPVDFTITPETLQNVKELVVSPAAVVVSPAAVVVSPAAVVVSPAALYSSLHFVHCHNWAESSTRGAEPSSLAFMLFINSRVFGVDLLRASLPKFLIRGHLDSTSCAITQPLTGELVVEHSDAAIRSIELQLVRVETCGCAEGYARDATEIQNIQIADGDICRSLSVPLYMVFPRLFTCPTLETTNFKVEFEVNVVVLLHADHLITENFPLKLCRT